MYAVVRRLRMQSPEDLDEAFSRVRAEYERVVKLQLGFAGHQVIRAGNTDVISVLLFETEDEANRTHYFTEQFLGIALAGLDIELLDEWRGTVEIDTRP